MSVREQCPKVAFSAQEEEEEKLLRKERRKEGRAATLGWHPCRRRRTSVVIADFKSNRIGVYHKPCKCAKARNINDRCCWATSPAWVNAKDADQSQRVAPTPIYILF